MSGSFVHAPKVRKVFDRFGPTVFSDQLPPLETVDVSPSRNELRKRIREHCPQEPGVYGMVDKYEELIYVGMSAQLRDRLLTYFYNTTAEGKQEEIASQTRRLVWEVLGHELTARLRELELIRRWRPKFNVRGQPGRTRCGYIYLTSSEAPRFRVDRLPSRGCQAVWGPVPLNYRMRGAVEQLNILFKLRDCPSKTPMRFADQQQLFRRSELVLCERGELGTCLAPCAGHCTRRRYLEQISAVSKLLDGNDSRVLRRLESALIGGSEQYSSGQMARLRENLDELTYLIEQLKYARDAKHRYRFVYEISNHLGATIWYLVDGGQITAVLKAPESTDSAADCLERLETTFGSTELSVADDFEQLRMVLSWFRKNPTELDRTIEPLRAIELCSAKVGRRAA